MTQSGLARDMGTPAVDITDVDPAIARTIPESLAWEFGALALRRQGDELTVAFSQTPADGALRRLERATEMRLRVVIAPHDLIVKTLARTLGRPGPKAQLFSGDAPAVRAVDSLHERAFYSRCSDIHIEPQREDTRVRFRVDGFLREVERFSDQLAGPIVSRIKLLAGMDIADRRQPQDGRYTFSIAGHTLDARVSSVPALGGENVVIRLLDNHARLPAIDELGMPSGVRDAFTDASEMSAGFIIVCGPTGSGKTTTLYAALAQMDRAQRAVCTVEDPVEQAIPGIIQVQVNIRAGVTFAAVLRAHLRQDPNVIMIGEMRDGETADTAAAAALSGQLVLTTLHSTDAPSAIDRLAELGVARATIAAGLSAVLAQRLVRRLCSHCKVRRSLDAADARKYKLDRESTYFGPGACERCSGTGFRDRIGIFELIMVDDAIRDDIAAGASSVRLARAAADRGYRTMRDDCIAKVTEGTTSVSEYARIAHTTGT